eukprot:25864-Ditylum_brightwellii.AAC.1
MVLGRDRVQTEGAMFFNADEDDSVGYGDGGGADDSADGAERHLVHLAQVANCCRVEISKQYKIGEDDGEDDSVGYGDDGGADD